jgi:hypothetical protein
MKRNLGSRCEDSTFYTGSIYLLICYNIIFDLFKIIIHECPGNKRVINPPFRPQNPHFKKRYNKWFPL